MENAAETALISWINGQKKQAINQINESGEYISDILAEIKHMSDVDTAFEIAHFYILTN